jgi:predicted enzyme related to lactoylglutathione lyase
VYHEQPTLAHLPVIKGEIAMKIGLTSIFVDDPSKAFKFYTEVLGFVKRIYVPEAELAIVVSPEEPDSTGLLLEPNHGPIAKTYQEALYREGLPAIVFGVDDIQKEYARLRQLGVVFRGEPTTQEWGTQAVFEDTCGNLIQLHQA